MEHSKKIRFLSILTALTLIGLPLASFNEEKSLKIVSVDLWSDKFAEDEEEKRKQKSIGNYPNKWE